MKNKTWQALCKKFYSRAVDHAKKTEEHRLSKHEIIDA